jgi:segregation and condensation protein B
MIMEKKLMSKSLKLIIEALLFSSEKPLTVKDIKDCIPDTDVKDIKGTLTILEHDYEAMDRSFDLREVAGGYQFRSKQEYGSYILRLLQSTPNRLSRAAMETLAIVAYKQPILKHEIEKLRGVDVGGILKTLMEKDLVKIMGRKDLPGKPLIYGTTKRFLEVFDLMDISDLPKMNEIKDFGLAGYEPTAQNQDNPLQPQGTEGLFSAVPAAEAATEMPADSLTQVNEAAAGEAACAQEQDLPSNTMPEETQDREPVSVEIPVSAEEEYQETGPEETEEEAEEYYQDLTSDDMPDEEDFFPEDEGSREGYNDMNGDYNPEDDPSEDGNEDDPKD